MMELLLRPATWRRHDELDPFLSQQYNKNAVTDLWGESTFLYWSDTIRSLPTSQKRMWITSDTEAAAITPPSRPVRLVRIGRARKLSASWSEGAEPLDVPTTAWTVHSDRESLLTAIDRLADSANVILFHTSGQNVNKWATRAGRDVVGLSTTRISLTDRPETQRTPGRHGSDWPSAT